MRGEEGNSQTSPNRLGAGSGSRATGPDQLAITVVDANKLGYKSSSMTLIENPAGRSRSSLEVAGSCSAHPETPLR